jgi:predicted PurR-regulated permease PerM
MVKKRITVVFLSVLTALALTACFVLFRPFIYPLISALIIAIVFAPVHHRVEHLARKPALAAEAGAMVVALRRPVGVRRARLRPGEGEGDGGTLVTGGVTLIGGAASFMLNAAISLFALFFVFREGRTLRRRLAALLPLTDEQVHKLFSGIENTIVGTVYGGLVVAGVQGAQVGLAFRALGIESPVLWGVVAAFFSLLPIVGTAVVWVPGVLIGPRHRGPQGVRPVDPAPRRRRRGGRAAHGAVPASSSTCPARSTVALKGCPD